MFLQFLNTYRYFSGGIWINLGPLLYHFADMRGENSIEPSFDILKEIIVKFGFEYLVCFNFGRITDFIL